MNRLTPFPRQDPMKLLRILPPRARIAKVRGRGQSRALWLGVWIMLGFCRMGASQDIPTWLRKPPPLPPPRGEMTPVRTPEELLAAVDPLARGGTILLADGRYQLPRPAVLDQKQEVVLRSASGVAFGNPGKSTANLEGERLAYVSEGIIRNSFIAGGPDCGIELWYADRTKVLNNTIWRPEQNWSRGIRVGTGTSQTAIANNLVHGAIQSEGGEATVHHNLSGRLEGYFEDPAAGNLALTPKATGALGRGVPLPKVTEDIRGRSRTGAPDLGGWESEKEP